MKRQIITIDENKCNGCGACIPNCPEGALRIIDGKARLASDLLCDGLGACLGHCPQGAISVEEREAAAYDEEKALAGIVKAGANVIEAHLEHLRSHGREQSERRARAYLKKHGINLSSVPESGSAEKPAQSGCPGMKVVDSRKEKSASAGPVIDGSSELKQWPVQLKLLNPRASYFQDAELVIAADCVPFSCASFHRRFLADKTLAVFCPKLDNAYEEYVEKLALIIKANTIKSITVVHMEVPCCFGTVSLVEAALKKSGKNIKINDYTISLQGEIISKQ